MKCKEEMDGLIQFFLDIKKAFDTVPHKRLLWKMEHIGGIRGTTVPPLVSRLLFTVGVALNT